MRDEKRDIEVEFEKARRTGRWENEERVVQAAFRIDPALGQRLRARQLYAPATVELQVAA